MQTAGAVHCVASRCFLDPEAFYLPHRIAVNKYTRSTDRLYGITRKKWNTHTHTHPIYVFKYYNT